MPKEIKKTIPLLALLLAWLVPGAGHFYLGRKARGIVIFIVIAATFWAGVAMGGVLTVDYNYDSDSRWWFLAQMCTGVHGVASYQRQQTVYKKIFSKVPAGYTPQSFGMDKLDQLLEQEGVALGHMPTLSVARAYAGVAGMLNLLCIVDALMLSLMGIYGESTPPPKKGAAA